jgi:Flp pilus assembly pilin Flp
LTGGSKTSGRKKLQKEQNAQKETGKKHCRNTTEKRGIRAGDCRIYPDADGLCCIFVAVSGVAGSLFFIRCQTGWIGLLGAGSTGPFSDGNNYARQILKGVKKMIRRRKRTGQAIVEYIIIIVIVAVAALTVMGIFSDRIRTIIAGVASTFGDNNAAQAVDKKSTEILKDMDKDGIQLDP